MRVLLAGASGAVGRYLVPQLLEAGHDVTGITRNPGSLYGTGASELVADVTDRPTFLAALSDSRFDAVVNQLTSLKRAPTRYSHMRETNRLRTEGTNTLIAAARQIGAKKFVTASLCVGYGFYDHGHEPLDESQSFGELSGGRLDAIQLALVSNEQQVRAFGGVALRYGLFYGDHYRPQPIPSDWNGLLPWVHLEDAATAAVLALAKGKRRAVYNIVDDVPASWRDHVSARAHAMGAMQPVALPSWLIRQMAPYGAKLVTHSSMVVSNARARKELGWVPRHPSSLSIAPRADGSSAAWIDAAGR